MLAAVLCALMPTFQDPAAGITSELAQARAAQVRDVHYDLRFRFEPGAREVVGHAWIQFALADDVPPGPVVLDFGGTGLADVRVNDHDATGRVRTVADHVVITAELLAPGRNSFSAVFRATAASSGTPLTLYRDGADAREYFYTLVVPADAHRLYPCFDQPDLKAVFRLTLNLPSAWTAVANTLADPPGGELQGDHRRWTFAPTAPLPTYLMAFACGEFATVTAEAPAAPGMSDAPLRIFLRPGQVRHLDAAALARLHGDGLRWLAERFGVPYPFGKLDLVLLPGFPYGGMEHAGAIFYREQALAFDHPPDDSELVRRSTLVYHELAHQWFGNLVTMRWFDDLWLKEGFATFLGYQAMSELEPERLAWLRFLQRVKPRAYEVDATPGTTPVWQALGNLADAKSAYGAIVYNKAPAVLRELHERLGAEAFRGGLQHYLREHAFGNATWQDLAGALAASARTDLRRWSDRWLLTPSLPRVSVSWTVDGNGLVRTAELRQVAVDGTDGTWPLSLRLLVGDLAGGRRTLAVAADGTATPLPGLVGRAAPAWVLLNPDDAAYAQCVPDATSREALLAAVADERDPLVRAVMVQALVEAVQQAELDPARLAARLLVLLGGERDPQTHGWLLDALGTCLLRWLPATRAEPLRAQATALLLGQLRREAGSGRELATFRFLARAGLGADVLSLCRDVVRDHALPRGLAPGKSDRFLAAAALLAAGAEDGDLAALQERFRGEDVGKELFLARAAVPTAANKAAYWQQYLQLEAPPEQWTQDSLAFFHWPGQEELTLPFLREALEKVDWVKQNRRIFFMPAWLDGFVNGHASPAALAVVRAFAAETTLDDDVRRKLLQSLDGLERAVRIRATWSR